MLLGSTTQKAILTCQLVLGGSAGGGGGCVTATTVAIVLVVVAVMFNCVRAWRQKG